MHLRITNIPTPTFDVHGFSFESTGALGITNEYSGLAVVSAHLYCFRRSQACMFLMVNLPYRRFSMNTLITHSFTAFVGIDWADRRHDVCIQAANSQPREFAVIPHKVELINEWAQSLVQRFGSPIAVAVVVERSDCVCTAKIWWLCYFSNQSSDPGQVSRNIHTQWRKRWSDRCRICGWFAFKSPPIALNPCSLKVWRCGLWVH